MNVGTFTFFDNLLESIVETDLTTQKKVPKIKLKP